MRLGAEASFRKTPNGTVLGTAASGSEFRSRRTEGTWTLVRLEGWVFSQSLARTDREGFDRMVSPRPENLRESPNGKVIGRLVAGALLDGAEERAGWTRVQRDIWFPRSAFQGAASSVASSRDTTRLTSAPRSGAPLSDGDRVQSVGIGRLYSVPNGDTIGTMGRGAQARVLSRSGDWVRVQVEGWVREADVRAVADTGVLIGVSAAEVRAMPQKYLGRVVEWRVQLLSVQRVDQLRQEIPAGRPYLLTRGPLPEVGFVYVMISSADLERFQAATPLQEMTVRAVVRAAATRYLPNPVVELVKVVDGNRP